MINYHFPSGVQGREHPNPGQRYEGTSRTAYLPDTYEGREVLQLLRRAFDARLVFTVGTSDTTGRSNQINGMAFTTRLASVEALMGKILFYMIYHYMKKQTNKTSTTIIRIISKTANARIQTLAPKRT